jgi:hypothetical protein
MKRYPAVHETFQVRGNSHITIYMELLEEQSKGFRVRITSVGHYSAKESEEYITKALLDSCLRTGYLEACDHVA